MQGGALKAPGGAEGGEEAPALAGLAVLGAAGTGANSTDCFAAAGRRAKGRAELSARAVPRAGRAPLLSWGWHGAELLLLWVRSLGRSSVTQTCRDGVLSHPCVLCFATGTDVGLDFAVLTLTMSASAAAVTLCWCPLGKGGSLLS